MKFEQLLQIYWSRGFLFGGKVKTFNISFLDFFLDKNGISRKSSLQFIKRFEFNYFPFSKNINFSNFVLNEKKIINMYLAQLTSINHDLFELLKYNLIRLYLIRSFRGRCALLGKPSRGQRTWSNSSTSKKANNILKNFVNLVKKNNPLETKPEKFDWRIKKKQKNKKPKIKMLITKKKKNLWF